VGYEVQFYAKLKRIMKWGKQIKMWIRGREGKKPNKSKNLGESTK
jgi:hypothetical protein